MKGLLKARAVLNDLKKYTARRKQEDHEFAAGFEEGYQTAVSRIENHSRDIRLSTLEKVASALGKRVQIKIL
jgi:hypothetical protein